MQLIINRPLLMANCQFKDLRENTLLSEGTKETHARQIQFNKHGGPDIIKNVRFVAFRYKSKLQQLTPVRQVHSSKGSSGGGGSHKKHFKWVLKTNANCDLDKTIQVINGKKVGDTNENNIK